MGSVFRIRVERMERYRKGRRKVKMGVETFRIWWNLRDKKFERIRNKTFLRRRNANTEFGRRKGELI